VNGHDPALAVLRVRPVEIDQPPVEIDVSPQVPGAAGEKGPLLLQGRRGRGSAILSLAHPLAHEGTPTREGMGGHSLGLGNAWQEGGAAPGGWAKISLRMAVAPNAARTDQMNERAPAW